VTLTSVDTWGRATWRRCVETLTSALAALVLAACGGFGPSSQSEASPVVRSLHGQRTASMGPWTALVDVAVATLWTRPAALRPMDAPSATNPVDIPRWLSRMTTADRSWLVGRVQTQALYGTPVSVLDQRGRWSYVAVHGQATPLNARGYPGWMPTRQLTGNVSLLRLRRTRPVAVVTAPTAWLRDATTFARRIQISFATRLPVVGRSGSYDLVATPRGGTLAIRTRKVAVYPTLSAIPTPTGPRVVRVARRFLGLQYLWGGTSGFGFDCSGFTYTVFRRFAISLPRDADRQALHGAPVARSNLRPGDLVFFAGPGGAGTIHHVAIYIGAGEIIHAPRTGQPVEISALASLSSDYAGARRYP
jgi:gamma-D-glutamyl-L-lysine dipeptidyl-peptidase